MAKKIVIDPGHGGTDGGATGNGIIEKDLTLKISKYMYNRFKELGVPVMITRDSDITLSPTDRVKKVTNSFGNSRDVIVISNHINAGAGEGAEVIYALRNNDKLASSILSSLEDAGQVIRKYYQRRLPSNSSKDYYFIIRDTANNESIIVEYGFLDNINDSKRLLNNYEKYAEAVVKAVCIYAGYSYIPLGDYYIVKKGDTLYSIAKSLGITVDKLKDINNLTSNTLSIGQVLSTGNKVSSDYYIVKKGDTLWSIAMNNNMTVDELKTINNLTNNNLSIGDKLILKNNYYIVKKGDTLYSIANSNNTSVNEIKRINNLTSDVLSIGQKLLLK